MTDKFNANDLSKYGENYVRINVTARGNPMKAHLTELRQVVDEHMEFWVRRRTRLANKLESDDAVIRVPFDSMKEKYYRDWEHETDGSQNGYASARAVLRVDHAGLYENQSR